MLAPCSQASAALQVFAGAQILCPPDGCGDPAQQQGQQPSACRPACALVRLTGHKEMPCCSVLSSPIAIQWVSRVLFGESAAFSLLWAECRLRCQVVLTAGLHCRCSYHHMGQANGLTWTFKPLCAAAWCSSQEQDTSLPIQVFLYQMTWSWMQMLNGLTYKKSCSLFFR